MNQVANISDDDKLFLAKLNSLIETCKFGYRQMFTYFLNEKEIYFAKTVLEKNKGVNYLFYGGYENAERQILCVYSEGIEESALEFPVVVFQIDYAKQFELSHRDFLGTFMSLNLKRSLIGDILVDNKLGQAFVFAHKNCEQIILQELRKIKNVGVQAAVVSNPQLPEKPKMLEDTIVVSSMRLDVIVGAISHLSRDKAASFIKQGLVFVNFVEEEKVSKVLKEGDRLTIRGKGKFIVNNISHISKKGKLHLCYQKYM